MSATETADDPVKRKSLRNFSDWYASLFVRSRCQWEYQRPRANGFRTDLLPAHFPVLRDAVSGHLCGPYIVFMYDRYVVNRTDEGSANTLLALADDGQDWFNHLERIEMAWTNATSATLTGYCSLQYETISPKTRNHLGLMTVVRRSTNIRSFYDWAAEKGFGDAELLTPESLLSLGVARKWRRPKQTANNKQRLGRPLLTQHGTAVSELFGPLPTSIAEAWKSLRGVSGED